MFCSQCGSQVRDGDAFCTRCGNRINQARPMNQQPVNAPPPINQSFQYQQQPTTSQSGRYAQSQPTERVIWVFRTDRKYSMFKMTPCHIVFMEDKVVLAYVTQALQKAESDKVSRELKESNTGFFKGSAAMMKFWSDYYKKYYTMGSAAILAEDPTNVILPNHQIAQVLFKGFYESASSGDSSPTVTQGKLEFEMTNGETIKFTHRQSADKSIQETLTRLFGGRLKYKR